jgi:predicted P-loop ATPase
LVPQYTDLKTFIPTAVGRFRAPYGRQCVAPT